MFIFFLISDSLVLLFVANLIPTIFYFLFLFCQVDKIVDQLMQYIYNYDLTSLRELWGHLDLRMFSRLESHFTPAVRKLENAVLKMYLVNAAVNNKQDRIQEFFTKMTPELQGHSEWKEWFGRLSFYGQKLLRELYFVLYRSYIFYSIAIC